MHRYANLSVALAALASAPTCLSAQNPSPHGATAPAQQVDYSDHFRVFTGDGKPATLDDIVRAMPGAEAVLIGEIHTDPVGHWIETELLRGALASARVNDPSGVLRPVALSMEMFERDVQEVVNEYLADLITESQFKGSARPWEYYDTDYRPMVEMAKDAGIPVIAANAPRRYVNRVSRLGSDALYELPPRTQSFLPPLPYPPPTDKYREEWLELMRTMPMEPRCVPPAGAAGDAADSATAEEQAPPAAEAPAMPMHAGSFMENGLQAQALWDASMAYAVTTFLAMHPGALVVHAVGGFHVEHFTGIPEQVQYYRPGTRALVVSMDIADDFRSFDPKEDAGRGDFVILTDKSLDLDYERNCLKK
jgi:uncharacterized iron-regulated protein